MIQMYPTPTTQEIEHPKMTLTKTGRRISKDGKNSHSLNLADTVKMYPTPTAGCVEGGEQSSRIEMTEKGGFILRKKNKPEMTYGAKLSDAMLYLEKMYPTPTARDYKDAAYNPMNSDHVHQNSKGWTKTKKDLE
jgi:hypothetical protein